MTKKTNIWRRVLPFFMAVVMLFSACYVPIAGLGISAPTQDSDGNGGESELYYSVVFENGVLRIRLNPQKVYEILRDGDLTKEELSKFIPEDILNTLQKGKEITIDDLTSLAAEYISKEDLRKLKELIPVEVLRDHFDLAMFQDLLTVDEILSVIPVEEILAGVPDEEIQALITPEVLKLLLTEKVKEEILTEEFVGDLLEDGGIVDDILADADDELRSALASLIDGAVVDRLLANTTIYQNLLTLVESGDTVNRILAVDEEVAALKGFLHEHHERLNEFMDDADVIEALRGMTALRESVLQVSVIQAMLDHGTINKNNVRTIFGDAQMKVFMTEEVIAALLASADFVDDIIDESPILNEIVDDELLSALLDAGCFEGRVGPGVDPGDPEVIRDILKNDAEGRGIIAAAIRANDNVVLDDYWEYVDFSTLSQAIGADAIHAFLVDEDNAQVFNGLLNGLSGAQILALIGEDECEHLLEDNLVPVVKELGLHKMFEYFDREGMIASIGGYYGIIQKGYILEDDVVIAIGGYPTLLSYLPIEGIIEKVGYDRLSKYVDFNDVIAKTGGYVQVLSWYSVRELADIVRAIGFDRIRSFLRNSGLEDQINAREIASDLIDLVRSKGDTYKAFIKEVGNRLLAILMTDFETIHINNTEIFKNGLFDLQAIVSSLAKAIPDVSTFLAMEEGDIFAQLALSASIRGEDYTLAVVVDFMGDFSKLQELAASYEDYFSFKVSDPLNVDASVVIPSIGSELYEKILNSSRISEGLKAKILEAPTLSVADLKKMIAELTDEELQSLIDAVSEKAEEIRDKAYAKIDSIEQLKNYAEKVNTAKTYVDKALNYFTNLDRIKGLREKLLNAMERIPDSLDNKTVSELYAGDQRFHIDGSVSIDVYERLLSKIDRLPEDILVLFGNDMTVSGSLNLDLTIKNVYQLTVVDENAVEHVFYLPVGFELARLNTMFPNLTYKFEKEDLMPARDTMFAHEELYQVDFYADDQYVDTVYYIKGASSLNSSYVPRVPEKDGYRGTWPNYNALLNTQKVIRVDAIYTPITYKSVISYGGISFEWHYTVADDSWMLPTLEADRGYSFDTWYVDLDKSESVTEGDIRLERGISLFSTSSLIYERYALPEGYSLPPEEGLTLVPKFDVRLYTVTFKEAGQEDITDTYSVLDPSVTTPVPVGKYGYDTRWYVTEENGVALSVPTPWSEYSSRLATEVFADLTVEAIHTPHLYSVVFKADGSIVPVGENDYQYYTIEDHSAIVTPNVPTKAGWEGEWYVTHINGRAIVPVKWSEYQYDIGDITVTAQYAANKYSVTFKEEGQADIVRYYFTDNATISDVPTPVGKTGYTTEWYVTEVDGVALNTPVKWSEYRLTIGNVIVEAKHTVIDYTITFKEEGQADQTRNYNVENKNITAPSMVGKVGYSGEWYVTKVGGEALTTPVKWSEYTLTTGDVIVEARFTVINYTVTFKEEGQADQTRNYNVENKNITAPSMVGKAGYNGEWYVTTVGGEALTTPVKWSEYTLTTGDVIVEAKFTIIEYKVTFVIGNEIVDDTQTYTVLDHSSLTLPNRTPAAGYHRTWYVVSVDEVAITPVKWTDYTFTTGDLLVRAEDTLITYTATFMADGTKVDEVTFTVADTELSRVPDVPAKKGYSGAWEAYTLKAENITIEAEYTLLTYKATFIADDKEVAVVYFTVNDTSITEPAVPEKEGYTGKWEDYTLDAQDITIRAIYTPIGAIGSDPGDDGGMGWLWWLLLILLAVIIIVLVILLILKNKKNGDVPPPEPEVEPEPEPEPIVPIVPIETLESVDVETADAMMTDEVAMTVIETIEVKEKAAGMKVIVNIHVLNDNFCANDTVDMDALKAKKLIPAKAQRLKVLADGKLDKPLTVIADSFSVQAVKMITLTGGHAVQKK